VLNAKACLPWIVRVRNKRIEGLDHRLAKDHENITGSKANSYITPSHPGFSFNNWIAGSNPSDSESWMCKIYHFSIQTVGRPHKFARKPDDSQTEELDVTKWTKLRHDDFK
jgi:hypothetical protein